MKLYLLQTGSVTEFLWVSVWVNYSVGNEINKKIPAFLPQIGIQVRFLKWKRLSEQTGLQTHHSYWHILLWCVFNFFGLQGNPKKTTRLGWPESRRLHSYLWQNEYLMVWSLCSRMGNQWETNWCTWPHSLMWSIQSILFFISLFVWLNLTKNPLVWD